MDVKLSTYGDVQTSNEQANVQPATEASNTSVTPEGNLEPPITPPATPENNQPPTDPIKVEEENNSSSFLLGGSAEPEKNTPPATPAQPVATFDWKQEIKKIDRKELLKEAGINDFSLEMDEYIAKGGNPADYLSARAIDYAKVTDEDLVKSSLKSKFPTFSPEEINRIYSRKYGVDDSLTTDEKEDRLLDLKAEGHIIREAKVAEQKNFKVPDAIPLKNEAYEQWEQRNKQQAELKEKITGYYDSHSATKTLNESKRVTINFGDGVAPFNFDVDKPELITQCLTDGGATYQQLMVTETGEPDVAKQQLVTLFSYNPQQFIRDIFNYGKSIGSRSKVAEGQNAKKPDAVIPGSSPDQKTTYKTSTYGG